MTVLIGIFFHTICTGTPSVILGGIGTGGLLLEVLDVEGGIGVLVLLV